MKSIRENSLLFSSNCLETFNLTFKKVEPLFLLQRLLINELIFKFQSSSKKRLHGQDETSDEGIIRKLIRRMPKSSCVSSSHSSSRLEVIGFLVHKLTNNEPN